MQEEDDILDAWSDADSRLSNSLDWDLEIDSPPDTPAVFTPENSLALSQTPFSLFFAGARTLNGFTISSKEHSLPSHSHPYSYSIPVFCDSRPPLGTDAMDLNLQSDFFNVQGNEDLGLFDSEFGSEDQVHDCPLPGSTASRHPPQLKTSPSDSSIIFDDSESDLEDSVSSVHPASDQDLTPQRTQIAHSHAQCPLPEAFLLDNDDHVQVQAGYSCARIEETDVEMNWGDESSISVASQEVDLLWEDC
jgi:hypothetical protein